MSGWKHKILDLIETSFLGEKHENFSSFLEKGFKLNEEDRFVEYDLELTPWHKEIAKWVDDPNIEWINLLQGTQTGKTLILMAFLLYISKKDPSRLNWYLSTEEEAKMFVTERLRPYIDGFDFDAIKKRSWKMKAFKVFRCRVKIGYATTPISMRSTPSKYVVGDECGIWKQPISIAKKRTRTFEKRGRKGLFASSPPKSKKHHFAKEVLSAPFYQWFVPCPGCKKFQGLYFKNLVWNGATEKEVRESTKYKCSFCGLLIENKEKSEMIRRGRLACVDPFSEFQEIEPVESTSRSLQVSALYSVLTEWATLAVDFLKANKAGKEELKEFIADELAEFSEIEDVTASFKDDHFIQFIDPLREPGFKPGFNLITGGVDVQRLGELYWVIMGWRAGEQISGHVLDYGISRWKDGKGQEYWTDFMRDLARYIRLCHKIAIDASDGEEAQKIYDFCNSYGSPFVALKDGGGKPLFKYREGYQEIKRKKETKQRLLTINSLRFKDDISNAFSRPSDSPGAWTFHNQTTKLFFQHLANEHKIEDKGKMEWKKRYSGAPNHYLSALVYATASMENQRIRLQTKIKKVEKVKQSGKLERKSVDIFNALDQSLKNFR